MKRDVIATPLFKKNLQSYLDHYSELGAVRFIQGLRTAYLEMKDSIAQFSEIGVVRRRVLYGKAVTLREYVLKVEPRDFLVLYHVPENVDQPVVLLNIRIGGQNQFKWM